MPDLPSFGDATQAASDAADSIRNHGRTLVPWLPDPPDCADCGALMYADETYDSGQAMYVRSWACKACGREEYRDEPFDQPDLDHPRPLTE